MQVHHRRTLAGIGAATLTAAVLTTGSGPVTAQESTTEFDTPGAHEFAVPADVCAITVDVFGAAGGEGTFVESAAPAGLGGQATATLPTTPGEVLSIVVGGVGGDAAGPTGGAGGSNGGAPGGDDGFDDEFSGGGGGGASQVDRGGATLVIAGGGGGSGFGFDGAPFGGDGGETGEDGGDNPGGTAGEAGLAGGNGGTGGAPNGGNGGPGAGGAGGDGLGAGGGGGAGATGGGGGGGGGEAEAGGGGGGSSMGPAGTTFATGVQAGDGLVSISFTPDPGCADVAADDTEADPVVATPRFTG